MDKSAHQRKGSRRNQDEDHNPRHGNNLPIADTRKQGAILAGSMGFSHVGICAQGRMIATQG